VTRVRVRGIYATALTALLDRREGFEVVEASPPIRRRFDADFETREADVRVETTGDRQGVEVSGDPDGVEAVADALRGVGMDAFAWRDDAALGSVFDAVVDRTGSGGAVLDLGDAGEAYLPYSNADEHVAEDDRFRMQVYEPSPPWGRDRPVAGTELHAPGSLATLVRGVESLVAGTPDGTPEHELARTTEMLPTDVPDDWAVRWEYGADDASLDALDDALSGAVERAERLEDAVADAADEPGDPGRVAAAGATTWVWFGRDCRFALDDERASVVETMPGHHRSKAAHEAASGAVDFAERLGVAVESFPFDAVTAQFGPGEGDRVAIHHGKPDGRLITLGRGAVTGRDSDTETVTVRREMTGGGDYDALGVSRENGDVATTKFREGRWWYPTVYRSSDGDVKGSYCNVCTPVEVFPDAVRYVDLHVDVVKHADGTVEVVDEDELDDAVERGNVSDALAEKALDVAERVARGIRD
jgi:hypothetical protein